MNNLANSYRATRQFDKALPLLKIAVEKFPIVAGPDHTDTLNAINNLGLTYKEIGQLDKALPLLEQALTKSQAKLGDNHPSTLNSLGNLGGAYLAANQPDKALPLLNKFLAHWRKQYGPENPLQINLMTQVGIELLRHKQFAPAEKLLSETLDIRVKTGADKWETFAARSLLGFSLLGQKKYTAAEPLLLDAYQGLKSREKSSPPDCHACLIETLNHLVLLYEGWGKQDEAARWKKELLKNTQKDK
jgi:tetratricopeptide (TPR) repeat protein